MTMFKKFKYYSKNSITWLIPNGIRRYFAQKVIHDYLKSPNHYVEDRVNYYLKMKHPFSLPENLSSSVSKFKKTGGTTYYFDLHKVIKCFPNHYSFAYQNGDVTKIPQIPTFLKSRPINDINDNSVLLKLNEVRHFCFVTDNKPFFEKKDQVVWRGLGRKPHRKLLLKKYYDHPMCDVGRTAPIEGEPYEKPFMSIKEQLDYKFILAIEGNDVATNLKWAMSSNSVVIMTKPKFETWFMEGRLKADQHYIEVQDDYSDLIDKMDHYLKHPEQAQKIIKNAHQWVEQFKDKKREKLISLLVAHRYFELNQ